MKFTRKYQKSVPQTSLRPVHARWIFRLWRSRDGAQEFQLGSQKGKEWLRGLDSNQDSRLQRPMCYQLHHPGAVTSLDRTEYPSLT